MRIMGIDPALSITGFGVIDESAEGLALVDMGIVKTGPESALEYRLSIIHRKISQITKRLHPDCMVL